MKKWLLACWNWLFGIPMVVLGVLTFVVDYALSPNTNTLLFTGLLLVVAGIAGYVWSLRRGSRY